jgi:methionyl-tRNA synthetase
MSDKTFYVTTPIYYVNARPHIGHAYTTIVADVLARRHRLLGDDTFFLTGTDEHGQKIERSAAAAGIPPQQFADQVSKSFEYLWKRMGITNNDYIRTTDPKHAKGVQKLFTTLYEKGFIYLDSYTGAYCVSDETFVDVAAGTPCPDCGRITEIVTEENFFFRLSDFQLPILDLIESGQLKIENDARRNEVVSFLKGEFRDLQAQYLAENPIAIEDELETEDEPEIEPADQLSTYVWHWALANNKIRKTAAGSDYVVGALKDLSVSRSSFTWGIPVPEPAASGAEEKHVIYVWLDALANYMTAIGYGSDDPDQQKKFEHYWPADLHLVGKEIIRFHCIYWPAFLLALNPEYHNEIEDKGIVDVIRAAESPLHIRKSKTDPRDLTAEQHSAWAKKFLPKKVSAHGWLLFDNSKMSKSKGNIVRTETILDAFGDEVYGKQFPDSAKADRDLFASDVLRYFLLREIPFGQDGSFNFEALITRYNADLANGYGNLVSRTLGLIQQNFAEGLSKPSSPWLCPDKHVWWGDDEPSNEEKPTGTHFIMSEVSALVELANDLLWDTSRFQILLAEAMLRISHIDGYLSFHKPWQLAKASDDLSKKKLVEVLYTAAESIRIITGLLYPILPYATAKVWEQLGLGDIEAAARNGELNNLEWGGLKPGTKLGPLGPIFPRADKGLAQIMTDMENPTPVDTQPTDPAAVPHTPTSDPAAAPRTTTLPDPAAALPVGGSTALSTGPDPSRPAPDPSATPVPTPAEVTPQITIDDFAKVELRVAQILVAERIPKADKLLRLEVDLGPDFPRRQILSGIAEWYAPEDLIGRRIVVITNLAPRKMRGLESHGMLLAASHGEGGKPVLATFGEDIALGSRLK